MGENNPIYMASVDTVFITALLSIYSNPPSIQLNLAAAQTSTQIIDTVLSSHLMTPFLPSIKSHLHLCHFLNKHNWPKEEETSHGYKWKLYYRQSARKQLK